VNINNEKICQRKGDIYENTVSFEAQAPIDRRLCASEMGKWMIRHLQTSKVFKHSNI
jgi:hypothetical protein